MLKIVSFSTYRMYNRFSGTFLLSYQAIEYKNLLKFGRKIKISDRNLFIAIIFTIDNEWIRSLRKSL